MESQTHNTQYIETPVQGCPTVGDVPDVRPTNYEPLFLCLSRGCPAFPTLVQVKHDIDTMVPGTYVRTRYLVRIIPGTG